jgi:hypothetical protein
VDDVRYKKNMWIDLREFHEVLGCEECEQEISASIFREKCSSRLSTAWLS